MTTQCTHTLATGEPCNAPALNGGPFCRHHYPQLPLKDHKPAKQESRQSEPLILPTLLDKPSILKAVNEVIQALAAGRIKRSVADTLLSAIKFAGRLLTEIAEACLNASPYTSYFQPNTAALAASGNRPGAAVASSPARHAGAPPLHPEHASSLDPSTARIIKELLAQTRQLSQQPKA